MDDKQLLTEVRSLQDQLDQLKIEQAKLQTRIENAKQDLEDCVTEAKSLGVDVKHLPEEIDKLELHIQNELKIIRELLSPSEDQEVDEVSSEGGF